MSVKTGSKSKILDADGNKGKIPTKNKLKKHKKKPKTAYAKFLEEQNKKDESAGHLKKTDPVNKTEETKPETTRASKHQKDHKNEPRVGDQPKDFKDLDGDELLDFFEQF